MDNERRCSNWGAKTQALAAAGLLALGLAAGLFGSAHAGPGVGPPAQAGTATPAAVNPTAQALQQLALTIEAQAQATAQALTPPVTATPVIATPATSTPLPSKPTATRRAAPLAEVLVDGLNIRSGPGSNYASIGKAAAGTMLPIRGQSGNCSWLQVVLEDGGGGWISGNAAYTAIHVACAAIAPADAPVDAPAAAAVLPTSTPRPTAAAPTAAPRSETPTRPAAAPASQPAAPGQLTSFEPLGSWRRGDEPYGSIQQTTVQAAAGSAAAQIDYDFPAEAGGKNYVVFLAQPPLRIPPDAVSLQLQVYGDGSGNFLNIWVGDAEGRTWQFTFGRIQHSGWGTMTTTLTPNREWPNGPVGEAAGGAAANSTAGDSLTPPLSLKAFILDGAADGVAAKGVIYLDDLTASTAAASVVAPAPQANTAALPAAAAAAAPAVGAAPAPSSAPTGKIAFTRFNGQRTNLLVYDLAANQVVAELPNMRHPDLAGGLLLANGEGGGQETILRMTDTGGNPRPITAHPEDAYPQWSPSMASLAYASTAYGDRRSRLFYQEDAGAQFEAPPMLYNERELFGDNPVYLDNWRIAFQGCNTWAGGSKCGIYSTDSKGGEPVQATSLTADIPTGHLGAQILFTSNRSGSYDVWAVNWDGSNLRQLTDNPAVDGLAAASPDYQYIAFVTNRDGAWAVYVMNTDGSNQRKLFDIGGGYGSGDYEWYRERISWGP